MQNDCFVNVKYTQYNKRSPSATAIFDSVSLKISTLYNQPTEKNKIRLKPITITTSLIAAKSVKTSPHYRWVSKR